MSKVKDWEEIERAFEEMENMSCKPRFPKLPNGWVTDEYQSVKWNREQVELNNGNYMNAVKDLNGRKNKARDSVLGDIYMKIKDEVGYNISRKSAIKIWDYAYEQGKWDGFKEIMCYLDKMIDLISDILHEQNGSKSGYNE